MYGQICRIRALYVTCVDVPQARVRRYGEKKHKGVDVFPASALSYCRGCGLGHHQSEHCYYKQAQDGRNRGALMSCVSLKTRGHDLARSKKSSTFSLRKHILSPTSYYRSNASCSIRRVVRLTRLPMYLSCAQDGEIAFAEY